MELPKPKIALYKKRSFGEKLNASFDFLKENWKLILRFTTYLILPLSLIQAISLNGVMGGMFSMSAVASSAILATAPDLALSYALYMLLYLIGMITLTSLIYAMMKKYNEREEGLQGITLGDLKSLLFRNAKRLLAMTLFCVLIAFFIAVFIGLLITVSPYTLLLTIPLMIAFVVPLALFTPIYLFEDITLVDAFQKTLRLGFATWGGIFLISLVMWFVANVLSTVMTIPWYIATIVQYLFITSESGGEATVSAGYSFLLYLLAIVQTFGAYLSMIFTFVGIAYQYGHASEVVDSITVETDIDNFDKL